MTTTAEKIVVPMMVGTGGYADYMAFAKNGSYALGIKPVIVLDGTKFGVPGSTWFAARLRSASSKALFQEEASTLVEFKKLPQSHKEAWPSIVWEKLDDKRGSTTISIMIPGSGDTIEGMQMLIDNIADKKLATQMVDYLEKIAGKENFAIDRETAIAWFDQAYSAYAEQLQKLVTAHQLVKTEMASNQGQFGMHAELLKKVYKAMNNGEEMPELVEEPAGDEKLVKSEAEDDDDDDNVLMFGDLMKKKDKPTLN